MRIINPDQDEYPGLVQVGFDDQGNKETYPYGITSLADKRDFLQKGDIVKFQIALVKGTNKKRATNVAAVRKYEKARVDSIKGQVCEIDSNCISIHRLHMTWTCCSACTTTFFRTHINDTIS